MRIICLFILLLLSLNMVLSAQAPGLVIQAGLSTSFAKDENITKTNQAHYGYLIGVDARLLDGDMYFIIGGQYHFVNFQSSSSPKFFSNNDWKIFMARLGLGFNVFKFSEQIVLRSKLLASVNFTLDSPKNGLNIPGYDVVNDSFLGVTTGAGITLGMFDFDLDFQYGVINAYKAQPKSTFNSFTLMAGFHF